MNGTHHYWNWRASALEDVLAHWQANHPDLIETSRPDDFGEYLDRTAELREMLASEPDPEALLKPETKILPRTAGHSRQDSHRRRVGLYSHHTHSQRTRQ